MMWSIQSRSLVTELVGERLQAGTEEWRCTCSRPPGTIETSSWFWRRI